MPQAFGSPEANARGLGLFTQCPRGLLLLEPETLRFWRLYCSMKFSGALPATGAIDDQDARTWDAMLTIESALNEVQAAELDAARQKAR